MKRSVLLFCVLCLLLTACGAGEKVETDWSEGQMVQAIWDAQGPGEYQMLRYNYEDFFLYADEIYGIERASIAGGMVFYAGGISAREVAVLRLKDKADVKSAEEALNTYIDDRAGAFAGYAPEEYAILEQSGAVSRGVYVALLIGPEQEAAKAAFAECFTAQPPAQEPKPPAVPTVSEPEPDEAEEPPAEEDVLPVQNSEELPEDPGGNSEEPEEDPNEAPENSEVGTEEPGRDPEKPEDPVEPEPWSYDKERLLSAWRGGDRSGLAEEDLEILAVCDQISPLHNDSLSDYKRELAIHDWMVAWAEYDPGALSSGPIGDPIPHNDDPYGFLTGGKGICLGYSTTFQLLMEMSGFECTIVHGTSHDGTTEHAWNMVKLDGEWYCVDVTWDDPVSSFPVRRGTAHRYFNVTSDFLRMTDHQWDESAVPEAAATDWAWAGD